MEAPDLTQARATIAGLMPDTCSITRNPGGVEDDELDPETLELRALPSEPWYTGPCLIRDGASEDGPDGISIPFDSSADAVERQLRRGDLVECLAAVVPRNRGRTWLIEEPVGGSFAVSRKASMRAVELR